MVLAVMRPILLGLYYGPARACFHVYEWTCPCMYSHGPVYSVYSVPLYVLVKMRNHMSTVSNAKILIKYAAHMYIYTG
jgi:hypothetical protein